MNSFDKPVDRKTGGLIAKNIIILTVLVAVCALSIFAWFTKGTKAIADGINVRSRADGVQVSWDGENFYDNLQAVDPKDISGDTIGPALNLSGTKNEPLKLSLVTGNGIDFFEPYLNRRIGTHLTNADGSWQGIEVNSNNSQGRYVDIDLYFRGTSERDIYLAGDSKVEPKDVASNYSDYGAFSKDYIAAASRVAFLDAKKENVSFIWAPNADIELEENKSGYTKYTQTATEEITISGGTTDIDGGVEDNGKTYYFWTFWDDSVVGSYPDNLNKFEPRLFEYNADVRYFTTKVTTYIPTYGGDNPSIPIFINESDSASETSFNNYNTYIDGAQSKNTIAESAGQYFGVTNTSFNIGNATCSNAMYIINNKISAGAKITYELGYDPYNKLLVVLNYQVEGGDSFDLGGQETNITTTVTYYPLSDKVNCALVNPVSGNAVSTSDNNIKGVMFTDSNKMNIPPVSITLAEQFTAEKNGDGYAATYKFKNNKTNQYLAINNGNVSYTASGSSFSLYYSTEFEGPVLKSGDYYLVIKNGKLTAVQLGFLNFDEAVTVYTGSSYSLNTGLETDNQTYHYYNANSKNLVTLNSESTPKLFTSTNKTDDTVKIGGVKIATLTKQESSTAATEASTSASGASEAVEDTFEYYTAHIVIRVWVEGTDREALVPLADGIFDMSLHFKSQ